jgi:hypothetical protein
MAQPGRAGRQPVGPLTEVLRPFHSIPRKRNVAWGTNNKRALLYAHFRRACAGRDCGLEWVGRIDRTRGARGIIRWQNY